VGSFVLSNEKSEITMQWIETGGGPLILVARQHLAEWRGVARRPTDDASDYDRACEVTEDVAAICIGDIEVIIFGDEPFRTTWLPDEAGGLVARWVYADSEDAVAEFLSAGNFKVLGKTGVSFTTPGDCLLFDSAEPGDDIRGYKLEVALRPGTYAVRSALVNPSAEVRLLLHRLVLISSGAPRPARAIGGG
jgi:hypothetical protein